MNVEQFEQALLKYKQQVQAIFDANPNYMDLDALAGDALESSRDNAQEFLNFLHGRNFDKSTTLGQVRTILLAEIEQERIRKKAAEEQKYRRIGIKVDTILTWKKWKREPHPDTWDTLTDDEWNALEKEVSDLNEKETTRRKVLDSLRDRINSNTNQSQAQRDFLIKSIQQNDDVVYSSHFDAYVTAFNEKLDAWGWK